MKKKLITVSEKISGIISSFITIYIFVKGASSMELKWFMLILSLCLISWSIAHEIYERKKENKKNENVSKYPIPIPQAIFFSKDEKVFNSKNQPTTTRNVAISDNEKIIYKEIIPKEKNHFKDLVSPEFRKFSMFQGFFCKKCDTTLSYLQTAENEFKYSCGICGLNYITNQHPQTLIYKIHDEQSKRLE